MSHILKSPFDKKEYREITLENGLTALLISDVDISTSLVGKTSPHSLHQRKRKCDTSSETDDTGTESDTENEDSVPSSDNDYICPETKIPGLLSTRAKPKEKKAKKSAAALSIGVGSFCDPDDIPGFAHFLEHMVFMGSKKYKKENAFDDFISKHGGESNAWTDAERTTFFFDIHKNHFNKALDIFAQFFISPLFLKGSVDREISAVDNEFQGIKANDNDRYHHLLGSLAFHGNPMSHFLCGNKKTLKTIPEQKGIDVYGRLRDFYQHMYSAHYMTLVIQAPEPLDDLEEMVVDLFESVPNNKLPIPMMLQHRDPFVPRNFHKLYKVIPTEDCQRLDICWSFPPLYQKFKVKPLDYLGVLITHEGPGSILSLLRKRNWALSLHGGNAGSGFDQNRLWSGFQVSITLTDAGMDHVVDVIRTVFEYVSMMQKCGPQAWFYAELRDIENIKFRFREELDPIENVEQVAENMQIYPLEHYLTGRTLILAYDAQLIRECLAYLTPNQSNICLWSKAFAKRGTCDRVCPVFDTEYALDEIPEDWKSQWCLPQPNPELTLPDPNQFIPTNFCLVKVPDAEDYPTQVLDNEFGRIWYKKDKKFKMPKGFILMHLMTPIVSSSVENAALCDLLICILQQQLVEILYAASLAGYEFTLEGVSTGIVIHAEGFSNKLAHVIQLLATHMATFTFTEELFHNVKAHLKKSYYNEMIKAYEFAKILRYATTDPNYPPVPDRYRIANTLTMDRLQQFHRQLMEGLYIEGLVTGNFNQQHAIEVGEFVQKQLCRQPLSPKSIPTKRLLQLPQGDLQCLVRGVNRRDTNSCVNSYYQQGPGTIKDTCLNELLTMRMKEPLFNKLRTEKQMGYSVFCQNLVINGILGFSVTVETHANKFKMTDIQNAISQFLQNFQKILNRMTKAQFNDLVKAAITSKQVEDTQLGDESSRYWQEIMDRYYIFDRQEKEIEILGNITQSELKAWYQKILSSSHQHISFQVEGCSSDSMNTENTNAAQAEACGEAENFLTLLTNGSGFIEDLDKFRAGLALYPYSQITL